MKKTITSMKQWLACLGLLAGFSASAQVATTYSFSQSAGTFTLISGGTQLAQNANLDENIYGPITIPAFVFDGVQYTSIYVSTNGYITFGGPSDTYMYEPISGTENFSGCIAAFGTDVAAAQAAAGTRNLRYQQVGNEFIIQWQNVRRYDVAGERISFQIRLNTATNEIQIVYGGSIIPGSETVYPEIGLRGPDNTFATNVNNREIVAATGSWLNSVAGTSELSTCYYNSANAGTVPPVGGTFTWTAKPDVLPTAMVSPNTSGCYGASEVVSVNIHNNGGSVIDFSVTPLTINASVTGANPMTFTPVVLNSGTLAINGDQAFQISASYDMSATGTYGFSFSTSLGTDVRPANDTKAITVNNHKPTLAFPDLSACIGTPVTIAGAATSYAYALSGSNTTSLAIPDDNTTGVTSTIVISGAGSLPASAVTATIDNLTHTYDGDLILTLIAPDGSSVVLSNQNGSDANFINTQFSDAATTPISSGDSPFTGLFNPETPFSGLTGLANGTWTLKVVDDAGFDVGTLNSWTLNFNIANSISTYSWSPATDLSSTSIANPEATASASTLYTLTVTDASGCSNSDDVQLTINTLPTVTASSTAAMLCEGSPVTLTGDGATSYSWTGTVTDGVAFTPSTTDTYTVTGTDANGCTNTATTTVTVNTLPNVTANASATTACAGDGIIFTGSGATTYVWTGGVTDNAVFNPATTDTYTVTGTDVNGCTSTASVTVTVNALPVVDATVDLSSVCSGSTVIFTGNGADTYTWTGGVTDGLAYTPASTQTYTVTGTDVNGCEATDTVSVTVNALPAVTATADATVCENSSVTLSGSGAATYTWTGGVTDGLAFDADTTATYTVTGTDGNGCTGTATTTITVNALPVVDIASSTAPSIMCVYNAAIVLDGESPAGGTWSGSGVSGTSFDPATAGAGTAVITYSYTDANGCVNSDTMSIVVDVCTGISTVANNEIGLTAYPNPANGIVNVTISNVGTEEVQLQMTNIMGQEVYNQQVYVSGADLTTQIDVSSFAKGTYLLKVNTGKMLKVMKIVKQ